MAVILSPFGSSSTGILLNPTGDTTGVRDSAAITAAVAALPARGGTVTLNSSGTWYMNAGGIVITKSGVYLDFVPGAYVVGVGTGDLIRMYDPSTYSTRTSKNGGGILGTPQFDITAMGSGSSAFHAGDILGMQVFMNVYYGGANTNTKGIHLDNNYYWTEQMTGIVECIGCAFTFDNSANTSGFATGSFDRANLVVNTIALGITDCLQLFNGATVTNGSVSLFGNVSTSLSVRYNAINLTGSNGSTSSNFTRCQLNVGVEQDDTVNLDTVTINFGAAGNHIFECWGGMDFSSGSGDNFHQSNNSGQFLFSGPVLGDPNLQQAGYLTPATQTISGNGQTITSVIYSGAVEVTNAGAFTGLILGFGGVSGQLITIVNVGTGSMTFAASGTSNVADGASDVIAVNTAATYRWSAAKSLWYRTV